MKNKTVGIYTICKNEIEKIEFFLERHKDADCILIIDTGSTDGTYELLKQKEKKYNNMIIKQKIFNPFRFDVARNYAFQLLPKEIDIAFSIDIDEYAEENWKSIIVNNWDDKEERYWYDWILENYQGYKWYKSYLHKNDKKFKWYYAVHEMIGTQESEPKGFPRDKFPKIPLTIYHNQILEGHDRESLYLKLLPIRLNETKEDIYGKSMLAYSFANNLKDYKKAIEIGEEALNQKVSMEYEKHYPLNHIEKDMHRWITEVGLEEYNKKNYEEALTLFKKAYEYDKNEIYRKNILFAKEAIERESKKNNNYKISVYTITKNEEKFVDEWVENMSEADEIVVLDTGSTDKTVEKLRAKGVKVEVKTISPWRFDVARNESMKLISPEMDICISTDLDERFEKGWAEQIRNNWTENIDRAKYYYAWSHDDQGRTKIKILYEKIHKNDGTWKWKMPVHEILVSERKPSEINWLILSEQQVMLHHYPDPTKSRGQYIDLMKIGIEEEPNNMLQNYYYGRELFYHRRLEESIKQLKKTVKLSEIQKSKAYIASSYGFIGKAFEILGRLHEAEAYLIRGTEYVKNVREPYIRLMQFYYNNKRWYSLIQTGLRTLQITYNPLEWYEDDKNYKEVPHDFLSIAFYQIGDYENGLYHLEKAIEYFPENKRFLENRKFFLEKIESNK